MRKAIVVFQLFLIASCDPRNNPKAKTDESKAPYSETGIETDSMANPCRVFKQLDNAEAYFQSANNRTKACPFDSLTRISGRHVATTPESWSI